MKLQDLDNIIEEAAIRINDKMKNAATIKVPRAVIFRKLYIAASNNPNKQSPVNPNCRLAMLDLVQVKFPFS